MKEVERRLTQHLNKYQNIYFIIAILLIVVFIIISPILFTKWSWYDLSKSEHSNIGEAIGGITAPIIGVVSGLLIFITFLKQNQFNKQQINNGNRETLLNLFKILKEDINSLEIKKDNDKWEGINAIIKYTYFLETEYALYCNKSIKLKLLSILQMFNDFLKIFNKYNEDNQQDIIKQFVLAYYNSELKVVLNNLNNILSKGFVVDEILKKIGTVIVEIGESMK